MKKIIITENQFNRLITETQDEIRLDKVQNFIKALKDSQYYDSSIVNKYMSRLMKFPFKDVLESFISEFRYDAGQVERILNKKRTMFNVRKGEDPYEVKQKGASTSVDTSFDTELNLNDYLNLLNQTVSDDKVKKYLINNIYNEKFFAKLNLVLGDFYPIYNKMKQEYKSTKQQTPFSSFTLDDLSDFSDPYTGEPLIYNDEELKDEKTKPVIKGDVIFKNMYTYSLANQLIYAKNILKNIMTHDIDKHQLIDHTIRSVNRYLSERNIDPEMRRGRRPMA